MRPQVEVGSITDFVRGKIGKVKVWGLGVVEEEREVGTRGGGGTKNANVGGRMVRRRIRMSGMANPNPKPDEGEQERDMTKRGSVSGRVSEFWIY